MSWRNAFHAVKKAQTALPDFGAACQHIETQVRAVTVTGGTKQYAKQCLKCGERIGSAISQVRWHSDQGPKEPPAFDEELRKTYREAVSVPSFKTAREEAHAAFWKLYDQYLASEEWAEKRRAVLQRDAGVCQGCQQRKASQVHHISYAHVGDELLFELVALCHDCHRRSHDHMNSEAA